MCLLALPDLVELLIETNHKKLHQISYSSAAGEDDAGRGGEANIAVAVDYLGGRDVVADGERVMTLKTLVLARR